ncbi:MAG TPA: ATP-binding protein [Polyangiaceae bacterium]|nr:ATP-binding protein [Polyangiaceae bacterium]
MLPPEDPENESPAVIGAAAPSAPPLPSASRGIEAVLDPVPGAWFFLRSDGTFAYVSLGACAWLGYSRAELRSLTVFDIDPEVTRESWSKLWSMTNPPDSLTVRTVHRHKDGTRSPVEVRAVRVIIDGEDLAVSYALDLTQSEETRAALANTQAELKRLIDHLPDLVFRLRVRPRLELSFVSPSSFALLGYAPEELLGSEPALRQIVHADDLDALRSLQAQPAGTGRRLRFIHRQGRVVWMELRTMALLSVDAAGMPASAAIEGIARDISETHEREQRAVQLHQRQKLEALGQLAGGIAHDFNNLLQIITGNTQLVRGQSAQSQLEPLLQGVLTAAERASSLVKQLLAFSRKGSVEFSDVDLGQVLSSLFEMLGRLMGEHIRVSCPPHPEPLFIHGNAAQLEQLIINLCVNARDALPRGGNLDLSLSEVPAQRLPASVERQLSAPTGNYACLTVRDDGEGMSAEVQRRMYEPFFTTKGPGKGTGLGLSTVYAVVQSHSGAIEVTSSPGQGSRFQVYFPRTQQAACCAALPVRGAEFSGKGLLALAAEDEPEVLRLTASHLASAGFRVLTARDGEEAVALIVAHGAELAVAVLDVIMPKQTGVAICQLMRDRGLRVPVVLVTGYDDEALGPTLWDERVSVLRKPFAAEDLLARVARVMQPA